MPDVGATLNGECTPGPSRERLATILVDAGFDVVMGTFALHVRSCGHFCFDYGGSALEPIVSADAETPDEMIKNGQLISTALSVAGVRHRFEVYNPDAKLVAYLHHDWPMPSNTSLERTRGR